MAKTNNYKSEDARLRERKHQFGQPDGNKRGNPSVAVGQREFYRWCESEATLEELKAYSLDPTKPYARRMFVMALNKCAKIQDFFDLTNQTHGLPKQTIETVDAPTIIIDLSEDEEQPQPKKKRGRKPKAKK